MSLSSKRNEIIEYLLSAVSIFQGVHGYFVNKYSRFRGLTDEYANYFYIRYDERRQFERGNWKESNITGCGGYEVVERYRMIVKLDCVDVQDPLLIIAKHLHAVNGVRIIEHSCDSHYIYRKETGSDEEIPVDLALGMIIFEVKMILSMKLCEEDLICPELCCKKEEQYDCCD
jgi:hypothetical protein